MGKKKSSPGNGHQAQSFGQMVSKAALSQLKPEIAQMVNELGQNIASQTTQAIESVYVRLVVIEQLLMAKFPDITEDVMTSKISDVEDKRDKLDKVEEVENGDVVRVQLRTKFNGQTEFQGTSNNKIYGVGSGATFGLEFESGILGMKTGEVKTITFGQNKEITAEITLNRVSRPRLAAPLVPVADPVKENENGAQI